MSSIVVCAGSLVGLSVAMMLADDGHDVTVLESDPHCPPAEPADAWGSWGRTGVAQFHQPHNLFTRVRRVCDEELPGLTERLLAAGCCWVDFLSPLPPTVSDQNRRPEDDALRFVTGRRPVVETVFARAAEEQRGLTLRRGVRVGGLLVGPSATRGVPHVAGVVSTEGEALRADLVVDAMGRRSPVTTLVRELGGCPPEVESDDRGYVYHTRYFAGPHRPARLGRAVMALGSISILTLHSDNDTWSITLFGLASDSALKAIRDPARFDRVVRACPLQAHWLDGEPLTDVVSMAGVLDRYRRFVVDGRPVVTGLAAVGDAWACTNPSAGRGISIGMLHAQRLRRAVRIHLDDAEAFALAWDDVTEREVAPYVRNQMAADRVRVAEMQAMVTGAEPPAPDPTMARLLGAAMCDADVFRAMIETVVCTALPQEVLARPGFREKLERYGDLDPFRAPGPDRDELLTLLAA